MPVGWEVVLSIPVGKVVLYGQDNERRDSLAEGIDSLDHRCLYAVARLGQLCLTTAVRSRNYYTREDNAHYEPSLIEVIDIVVHNAVLGSNVPYKRKPLANNLRVLVLGPLVVVSTRITCTELWLAFDEVICLAFADRGRVTFASEIVGHIFNVTQPRRKCTYR